MRACYNKKYEREFVNLMTKQGLACFRIAGSGVGEEAVCDCVLLNKKTYLVEVKATKKERLYLNPRVKKQLKKLYDTAIKNSTIPLLAIKFKRRGWNYVLVKEDMDINVSFEKNRGDLIESGFIL